MRSYGFAALFFILCVLPAAAQSDGSVTAPTAPGSRRVEEVHARHILVSSEAEANEIIEQLKKGADFAKLASEKTIDPAGRVSGGDLGYFTEDEMVPAFAKAAFALKKGEFTQTPVKTQFGWHVIKVEDRRTIIASEPRSIIQPPSVGRLPDGVSSDTGLPDDKKDHATSLEWVHARHLLVSSEHEARSIVEQLKHGADFAKLASEKSMDNRAKTSGGEISFTRDDVSPEFAKAASNLKIGEFTHVPVKTEFGWEIIKVLSRHTEGCTTGVEYDVKITGPGATTDGFSIELRRGIPGASMVLDSATTNGGTVAFRSLCSGPYFLAIGNGDMVDVTPVHAFSPNSHYAFSIEVSTGPGNVSHRSRNGL